MKNILRITIKLVRVEDDYQLDSRNEDDEDSMFLESDGHVHLGAQAGEQFLFVSMNNDMNNITPAMQFLYWSGVAWQGFVGKLPEKLRHWMTWFLAVKVTAASYASTYMQKSYDRMAEVNSRTVNFRDFDPELFDPTETWWSAN